MGMLIRVALIATAVYLVYRLVAGVLHPRRSSRFQCHDCEHAKELFDDGVICRFAGRETFKNEVHIANCGSHSRRGVG
jgi:hypothetical protein